MSDNLNILVVGAGPIAREHVKVIEALGYKSIVIGRGEANIAALHADFPQVEAVSGGLETWLKKNEPPAHAIVATPIHHLANATRELLKAGCKHILAEKPLTYSQEEARELASLADQQAASVHIAFNRRSYLSVEKARELIASDGGVSSFHFDFTEAVFRIDPANYSDETTKRWGIANSSHVIDTAFYLGGHPRWMENRQYGSAVHWHPAGSVFTGMGQTEEDIPFTYHANWGCPGKWNIEIMTPERKLLFSPMERLHQQLKGGFKVELVDLDYTRDIDFKPGFFSQVERWLAQDAALQSLNNYNLDIRLHNKIFGY